MPYAAHRYCGKAGCHNYAVPSSSYCVDHQQSTAHEYDKARQGEFEHEFYKSAKWRMAREWHLAVHPLCEDCLAEGRVTPATMVHHVKELRDYPALALEQSNLRSDCDSCHNKKHPTKGGTHDD